MKVASSNTLALAELRRLMLLHGLSVGDVAALIPGVCKERLRTVILGYDTPGLALAGEIARQLGFPPGMWFEPYAGDAVRDNPIPGYLKPHAYARKPPRVPRKPRRR